jgi:hypothetical protein
MCPPRRERLSIWCQALTLFAIVCSWGACFFWMYGNPPHAYGWRVDFYIFFLIPLPIFLLGRRFCSAWKSDREGFSSEVAYALGLVCALLAGLVCLFGLVGFAIPWVFMFGS